MAAPSPVEKAQDKQRSFKETYLEFSCNLDCFLGRGGHWRSRAGKTLMTPLQGLFSASGVGAYKDKDVEGTFLAMEAVGGWAKPFHSLRAAARLGWGSSVAALVAAEESTGAPGHPAGVWIPWFHSTLKGSVLKFLWQSLKPRLLPPPQPGILPRQIGTILIVK